MMQAFLFFCYEHFATVQMLCTGGKRIFVYIPFLKGRYKNDNAL